MRPISRHETADIAKRDRIISLVQTMPDLHKSAQRGEHTRDARTDGVPDARPCLPAGRRRLGSPGPASKEPAVLREDEPERDQ